MEQTVQRQLRANFESDVESVQNGIFTLLDEPVRVLTTAVELPSGAIEIATNTEELQSKIDYILSAYDKEFRLKANPNVKLVGYMIV